MQTHFPEHERKLHRVDAQESRGDELRRPGEPVWQEPRQASECQSIDRQASRFEYGQHTLPSR